VASLPEVIIAPVLRHPFFTAAIRELRLPWFMVRIGTFPSLFLWLVIYLVGFQGCDLYVDDSIPRSKPKPTSPLGELQQSHLTGCSTSRKALLFGWFPWLEMGSIWLFTKW
jgi:hypothetical protein